MHFFLFRRRGRRKMSSTQEKDMFQKCADVCRKLLAAYEQQDWDIMQEILKKNEWVIIKSREIRKSRSEETSFCSAEKSRKSIS